MSPTAKIAATFVSLAWTRAKPAALAWFEAALADLDPVREREHFHSALSAAGRRLGRDPVVPDRAESDRLAASGLSPFPTGMGLDECVRGALILLAFDKLPATERLSVASDLYTRGEVRERQALLRVLAYLPAPTAFRELAVEACRASAQSVFEAIACENPYPAAHFDEAAFNHMVLKAAFCGVDLGRIAGLPQRVTPELMRMAEDFAAERRAAGREVPDLSLILAAGTRTA
ncbi:MAG TPA: EboA domain-containing protein [Vicinamibacteria bacterium]